MSTRSLLPIPPLSITKLLMLACLLVAVGIAAAACGGGEKEVFTGEPTSTIAFASDRDGNSEIYVMNGDGSQQVNITNNEAADQDPWWSPDGARLAFSSLRSGSPGLFIMNADGSDVKQLTEGPAEEGSPRWSPDGKRIVFYSFREQSKGLMWIMNADGSDAQPVLEEYTPAGPEQACAGGFPGSWFPNGQRILYRGSEGGIHSLQICSVAPDGSDIKVIHSEDMVKSYYPSLSPDGSKIAFTSDRDGHAEIYVMNADGGHLRRLTNTPYDPTRAEDGAGSNTCGDKLDNGNDTVTDDSDPDCFALNEYPTWSPDGQWIAFHSDRDGDFEIYIVRPDGSDLRQLTDNDANDMYPSWSPR
jgi:Tol biopolymer transport system component